MLVLGIDPSAKRIAASAYETASLSHVVRVGELYVKGEARQTPQSLARAQTFMEQFILDVASLAGSSQKVAYVETPLVGRGGIRTTIKQAYVGGIIRGCLAQAGFEVFDAHPSTWRKELGIAEKGTAAIKRATRLRVLSDLPRVMPDVEGDSDLIDASAIVLFGLRVARPSGASEPS